MINKTDITDVEEIRRQALDVLAQWSPTVQRRDIDASAIVVAAAAQLFLATSYLEEAIKRTDRVVSSSEFDVNKFAEFFALLASYGQVLGQYVLTEAEKEADRVRTKAGVN